MRCHLPDQIENPKHLEPCLLWKIQSRFPSPELAKSCTDMHRTAAHPVFRAVRPKFPPKNWYRDVCARHEEANFLISFKAMRMIYRRIHLGLNVRLNVILLVESHLQAQCTNILIDMASPQIGVLESLETRLSGSLPCSRPGEL